METGGKATPGGQALLDLNCNHCGAPLSVAEAARFVTCEHCGSRLAVHRESGAAYTEVLERVTELEEATEALSGDLQQTRAELALSRLDDEWKERRRLKGWSGPGGQEMPPNIKVMRGVGIFCILSGILLVAFCLVAGIDIGGLGSVGIALIGLVVGVPLALLGFSAVRKGPKLAAEYEQERAEHDRRRAELRSLN